MRIPTVPDLVRLRTEQLEAMDATFTRLQERPGVGLVSWGRANGERAGWRAEERRGWGGWTP